MAGNPRKRARRAALEAEQAAESAKQAAAQVTHASTRTTSPGVEALNAGAPASAHTRARQAPPTNPTHAAGTQTRDHFDRREAQDYAELTGQLEPGIVVRILRTRPTWAEGWIEDYELDDGDLSELMHHIRSEHGGQRFRVQVLSRDNRVMYQAKVPIAGPVRRDGRVVTREQWESGLDAPAQRERDRERNVPPPSAAPGFNPIDMMRMVLDLQKEAGQQISTAVSELRKSSAEQTQKLVDAVVETRKNASAGGSLGAQLTELVKVTRQVDEIRSDLAASAPTPAAPAEPADPTRGLVADIIKMGFQNEMNKSARASEPAQQRPPRRRVVVVQQPQQPTAARPVNGHGRRSTVEPLDQSPAKPGATLS